MNEIAGAATRGGSITPPPETNRSALSEAWYRALYRSEPKNARPLVTSAAAPPARSGASPRADGAATPLGIGSPSTRGVAAPHARTRPTFSAATPARLRNDRRSAVTPAARDWRSALARRTMCRLTLPEGVRIDLLLQQRGRRLHVVAIARGGDPAPHRVAAALLRARAVLLTQGVRLATSVHPKGSA